MKYNHISILLLALFIGSSLYETAHGQGAEDEVFLQFRHAGVVNTYLSTIYHEDRFYVSVSDLFSSLQIDHTIESGSNRIQGMYPGRRQFTIQFFERFARIDGKTINFTADDIVMTDFGYYLRVEILYELFEMQLIVNFSNLTLSMIAPDTMPVVEQRRREVQRDRLLSRQTEIRRDFYPLRESRNASVFNAGFVDYNVTTNLNRGQPGLNYSTSIGSEILGGDVQGTILGNYTENASVFRSTGLRWRYGIVDNSFVSLVNVGQNRSSGITSVAYTGIQFTNEPIEPRFMYGESALTGSSFSNADVELFRNNVLIDYTLADESGFYSFNIPITYGSTEYSIRTFSPGGLQSQRDLRFRIPNSFIPPGKFDYTVDVGRLDNPVAGSIDRGYMGQASIRAGLTNRITFSGGAEYFDDFHEDLPTFTGRLSTRLLTNHLLSFEAASEAFYRGSIQSTFVNNASFNAEYTYFQNNDGIYNRGLNTSVLYMDLFTPFQIGNFPLFLRWGFSMEERDISKLYRYRVDLNTRIGRANLRIGFKDVQSNQFDIITTGSARLTASSTYTFRSQRNTSSFFNGLFFRAQMNYLPAFQELENAEVQISRKIRQAGRFQLSAGRNFISDFNQIRFTFSLDFKTIRSNTNIRSTRSNVNYSQSFRGSIGYDSKNNNMVLSNRAQVGRAGVAVRLFVDNNNNGNFDEEDTIIHDQAVRIMRSSGRVELKNGINYVTQLQSYRQYNLEVNKGAISNPLLVPAVDRFSFIADPNQFKTIDIPFYTSGIIDGMVYRERDGQRNGLGGMRLYLVQINTIEGIQPHREEIRTFSDGSFYAYEIPPGDYEIRVDQAQKDFLGVKSNPDVLELTVRALSEGDFVEGLVINLVPKDPFEVIEGADEDSVEVSELIPDTIDIQQEEFVAIAEEETEIENLSDDEQVESIAALTDAESGDSLDVSMQDVEESLEEALQSEETFTESEVDSLIADVLESEMVDSLDVSIQDVEEPLEETLQTDETRMESEVDSLIADVLESESVDSSDVSIEDSEESLEEALLSEETLTESEMDSLIAEDSTSIDTEDAEEAVEESIAEALTDEESEEEPIAEALSDDDSTEIASEEELIEQAFANAVTTDEDGIEGADSLEFEGLDESLIMDPNQERTISDIQIFTQDASCRFSIQMAEYRSLEEAFNGANRFERETGLAFQIYSAGPQSPFTIRTPEDSYFGEVLTTFNELLARSPSQKPAIITQCAENEEASPLRFLIQLATFSSEDNAESFRDELRDQYQITSRLDLSGGALIRVQAGPYINRRELLNAFRILAQDNVSPGMFIMVDPSSYFNMSQEFRLQVGVFNNPRDAVRYAFEISEAFNIDTFLIIDGSAVKVMVNKNYEAWDDAFRDFTLISSYENVNQPAIHLSEQE